MSTGTSHSSKRSVKSSIGLVALLIVSSLGMIISAPIASASVMETTKLLPRFIRFQTPTCRRGTLSR